MSVFLFPSPGPLDNVFSFPPPIPPETIPNAEDWRGAGDGGDTAMLKAAIAGAGAALAINAGIYTLTEEIDLSALDQLILNGEVTFDFRTATDDSKFLDNAYVYLEGPDFVALPDLAASPAAGDTSLVFASDPGLSSNDVIVINDPTDSSWLAFRPEYRKGEFIRIADGSGGATVGLFGALYDNYDHTVVDVYKMPGKRFTVVGGPLNILESTSINLTNEQGFAAWRMVDSDFSAFRPSNSNVIGMFLRNCIGITGTGYRLPQNRAGANSNYGLIFFNCQDCVMEGEFYGQRHGVTTGGGGVAQIGPVNRNIHVSGIFRNAPEDVAGIMSAHWHGNAEYCSYRGFFHGGVGLGGNHNEAHGVFIGKGDTHAGFGVYGGELNGMDFKISGRVISYGDPWTENRGVVDVGGNSPALSAYANYGGTLDLSDLIIDAPLARRAVVIRNRGYTGPARVTINLNGTEIRPTAGDAPLSVFIESVSGDALYVTATFIKDNFGGGLSIAGIQEPYDKIPVGNFGGMDCRNGDALSFLDFDFPELVSAVPIVRWFRSTDTVSGPLMQWYSGDGTGSLDAQISPKGGHTYFCNQGGRMHIGDITTPDYRLHVSGSFGFMPPASASPANNGDMTFQLTNDTTLVVKVRGSDGVIRSNTLTLA